MDYYNNIIISDFTKLFTLILMESVVEVTKISSNTQSTKHKNAYLHCERGEMDFVKVKLILQSPNPFSVDVG